MVFVIAVVSAVLVSGLGVPDTPFGGAAAASSDPEPSVEGRDVPEKQTAKGAEDSVPKVARRAPVWPEAGSAAVDLARTGRVTGADGLPVAVGKVTGSDLTKVKVETLSAEKVRALGGVGIAARLTRADGSTGAGKVRAEFSYAGFRDAYGGNFAGRLRLMRLPACALETPRPRSCVIRPTMVASDNDIKAGTLTADVEDAADR